VNALSDPAGNGSRDMEQRPRPVRDSMIHRLHALLEEQPPNSAHRARIHLLERLPVLEREVVRTGGLPQGAAFIRAV
jgi:hypothetical protein